MPAEAPRDIVLVVDDSPGTLGMLTDALEDAGYTVLVATDGAAAIGVVERVTPDIILMDALMPGMDGFEACRHIKQRPDLANVPVIFMTGLKDTESVVKGLGAGGVDYVTKPAVPDEIVARIRVHLVNARRTSSAQAALDTSGRFLLAVAADGTLRWITPHAARLLAEVAETGTGVLRSIGAPWLRAILADGDEARAARLSLPSRTPARKLALSFVGRLGPDEYLLRLLEDREQTQEKRLGETFGLTAREAQVLLWISNGKQNRDIADILGMSPRTVNKHLEQIYAKMGVENRAMAATRAVTVLREAP